MSIGAQAGGAEVRGTAFLGIVSHVRAEHGQAQLSHIVERAGPVTQAVFSERIRKLSWYPYEAYAGFLRSVVDELAGGELEYCVELGEVAAKRDLASVFSFFTRLYTPERMIRACSRVWDQYYRNAGHMQVISTDPNDTVLRICDFPGMHPGHCRLMEGWMVQAMVTVGATILGGAETACPQRGDDFHEFSCRWK